jgi:hypothetical protein
MYLTLAQHLYIQNSYIEVNKLGNKSKNLNRYSFTSDMMYDFLCDDYCGNHQVSLHFSGQLSYRVLSTSDEKKKQN